MLEFKIVEIPDEHSSRVETLEADALDLDPYEFRGGVLSLDFYRTLHFIKVRFQIETEVQLVCDRSLETYLHPVDTEYEVVFKVDVHEETEDEKSAIRRFDFDSNSISIRDEVRDTILLSLPTKKLHPRFLDEQGNPTEFETRTYGPENPDDSDQQDDELADPRWEKLKQLKNKNKDNS